MFSPDSSTVIIASPVGTPGRCHVVSGHALGSQGRTQLAAEAVVSEAAHHPHERAKPGAAATA
jgi:hypothetical protein